jgi:hypothetical protein
MRKFLIATAAVVVVFVVAVAAIVLSGNLLPMLGRLFGPDHDFDPARAVPAPDYATESALRPDGGCPHHRSRPAARRLRAELPANRSV